MYFNAQFSSCPGKSDSTVKPIYGHPFERPMQNVHLIQGSLVLESRV